MWLGGLPGACAPLWQDAQLPSVCSWSKRVAGDHVEVEWQAAHRSPLRMWPAGFGVAPMRDPGEWQEKQSRGVPLKTAAGVARLAGLHSMRAGQLVARRDVIELASGTLGECGPAGERAEEQHESEGDSAHGIPATASLRP